MNFSGYRWALGALGVLTLLSLAAAGGVAWQRWEWEQGYRQVSLSLSGEAWLSLVEAGIGADRLRAFQTVAFDAALLGPFAPLGMAPLSAWGQSRATVGDEQLSALRRQGLGLVVVLSPLPILDAPRVVTLQQALQALSPVGLILTDTQTLRWPMDSVRRVLELVEPLGLWVGTPEFSEPQGLLALYRQGHPAWVRAHLIPLQERFALSSQEALARYERGVRERSIRLLVLNARDSADVFLRETDQLAERLRQTGFTIGPVQEAPVWTLPMEWPWAASLFVLAGTLWLFRRLWRARPGVLLMMTLTTGALIAWQWARADEGMQFLALCVAILWPLCLYRLLWLLPRRDGLSFALQAFVWGSGASILAGIVQAAFLSDPAYFLKLDEFHGVKLALIEPLLLIAYWELKRRGPGVWKNLWRRPVTWGEAVLGAGVLGAFAVLVLRSGNESFLPTLPFEQELRGQLETWLYARPRFKEFLIGHPALIVWLAWGLWRLRGWGPAWVVAGFLGQVTLLNSFAHLHTPLELTLLRSFNGMLLGGIAGALLWWALRWVVRRWPNLAWS